VALLALLFILLLGLFGVVGGSPSSSSGSGSAQPQRAITLADSGRTVTLRRGEQAVLRLPSRWVWAVPATTGRAVELSDISSLRDTGYTEWGLDAARTGTWTFRTTGQPGAKGFSVKIRVR
jgi:predicted secreted protein